MRPEQITCRNLALELRFWLSRPCYRVRPWREAVVGRRSWRGRTRRRRSFRWRSWRRPRLWRHAFRRWSPRRCEVRRLTFIFSRGLSRRPFFCRSRREELRPDPKHPGAIRKHPQRNELAVAHRRIAQRPFAQQSRRARTDRRGCGIGGLAWRRPGANGWWQHGDGGYGWVGPLFWPFAYNDIYDYTIWGDNGFWDYGYPDIYAGIFAPYGYDDLAGYMAQPGRGGRHNRVPALAQMCGDDSRDVAGLPIDQIQQAIQPNEAQRAALDDLANASIKAAQTIRSACPTQVASTAPGRLAAMQQRIEAMISGVALMRPPLEKFYGLLDDEQKARFNALAEDQRKTSAPKAVACPKLCRRATRRVSVAGQRARGQAAPERPPTRRPRGGAG